MTSEINYADGIAWLRIMGTPPFVGEPCYYAAAHAVIGCGLPHMIVGKRAPGLIRINELVAVRDDAAEGGKAVAKVDRLIAVELNLDAYTFEGEGLLVKLRDPGPPPPESETLEREVRAQNRAYESERPHLVQMLAEARAAAIEAGRQREELRREVSVWADLIATAFFKADFPGDPVDLDEIDHDEFLRVILRRYVEWSRWHLPISAHWARARRWATEGVTRRLVWLERQIFPDR